MRAKFKIPRLTAGLLLVSLLCGSPTAFAQAPDVLDVEAVVCRDVVDRKPVSPDTSFPDSVGKLYCFTKISGAKNPTTISHVWYYGNTEMFRISLPVNAFSWRTYSLKNVRPQQTGVWHVEILDALENKLEVINFQILEK